MTRRGLTGFHFAVLLGAILPSTGCGLIAGIEPLSGTGLSPKPLWTVAGGDTSEQWLTDMAVNPSGEIAIVGRFESYLGFPGCLLENGQGPADIFVAKLDPDGHCLWARNLGTFDATSPLADLPETVAIDEDGRVFVAGRTNGSLATLGCQCAVAPQTFLAVLNANGVNGQGSFDLCQCAPDDAAPTGVAPTSPDGLVVTGIFKGPIDLGCGPLMATDYEGVAARLDASGGCVWSGSQSGVRPFALTALSDGTIVGGGTLDEPLPAQLGCDSADGDVVVTALEGAAGTCVWRRSFESSSSISLVDAAADGDGVVLTGSLEGEVDFGGGPLEGYEGNQDAFIVKLGSNGAHRASIGSGSTKEARVSYGHTVATDAKGSVVLGGMFSGQVDWGGAPLTAYDDTQAFVVTLSPTLEHVWSRSVANATDRVLVGADAEGNAVLAGSFRDSVDLGSGLLKGGGKRDIFIARYPP